MAGLSPEAIEAALATFQNADHRLQPVGEIDGARIKPGEDETLQLESRRLSQAGTLVEQAQRIVEALEGEAGNALGALGVADRALTGLEKLDPSVGAWREMLDTGYANLLELTRLAGDYAGSVQEDPERLAFVEAGREHVGRGATGGEGGFIHGAAL